MDWLSRDEEEVAKYNADPLCGFTFTVNGFETPEIAGTITLSLPVGEVDGLPILSATTIAEIFGYEASFDETGTYINITTPLITSQDD